MNLNRGRKKIPFCWGPTSNVYNVLMVLKMDGWMNAWVHGKMDGWIGVWMGDRCLDAWWVDAG